MVSTSMKVRFNSDLERCTNKNFVKHSLFRVVFEGINMNEKGRVTVTKCNILLSRIGNRHNAR